MLEDFRLKVFMAVVQECSFTKAASVLGITQPAVSQNIADLEKMTGRKLFDRHRGSVVLTTEGEVFMSYARKLIKTCSEVDYMFAKLSPVTVRISASEELYTYFIGPALEDFTKVHPDVVFERCMFGEADLVIALVPPSSAAKDEVISRIRMALFVPQSMDSLSSTQEKTTCFDVVYRPSAVFACTCLCRLLRHFLVK